MSYFLEDEITRYSQRKSKDAANILATQLTRLNNTPINTIKGYQAHQEDYKVYRILC